MPYGASPLASQVRVAAAFVLLSSGFAGALRAEDQAFVLDTKGQKVLLVDLRNGEVRSQAPLPSPASELLRSGDGRRLIAIDPGPHSFTLCCGMKPKGPMTATLLDAPSLSNPTTVTLGYGMPAVSFPGFTLLSSQSLLVPSLDGRRISIVCAGYRSKKPEETQAREIVTLDTSSAEIVGRIPIERTPSSVWRLGGEDEAIFFVAGAAGKSREPAEVLFADLAGRRNALRIPVDGAIDQAVLTPDSKWLYVLDPGAPSHKPEKNINGLIHVISVAERKLVASLDAGSNPRGFFWDESGARALVLSDGTPAPKGQVRMGEVRILAGPEIEATVDVPPMPHLVRFLGDRAFVAGKSTLTVLSIPEAKRLHDVPVDDASSMDDLSFSVDGRRGFALFSGSSRLSILDIEAPRIMGSVTTGRGGVKFAKAFGAALASAAATGASYGSGMATARTQGRSYFTYNTYNFGVAPPQTAVVVRPDGTIAYAANSQTNDVTIVDVESAQVLSKEAAEARSLVLFPNGQRLAILGKDELRLLDPSINRPGEPVRFADASEVKLVFTQDGSTAVAWGGRTLVILDAVTGAIRGTIADLQSISAVLFDGSVGSPAESLETPRPEASSAAPNDTAPRVGSELPLEAVVP